MRQLEFITKGSKLNFSFIRMPRVLFENPEFSTLSLPAKIAYSFLLDRTELSKKNGWIDEEGRVYIIYPIEELAENLGVSHAKTYRILNELDDTKGIGLIKRCRQGLGMPNILYVKQIVEEKKSAKSSGENGKKKQGKKSCASGSTRGSVSNKRTTSYQCKNKQVEASYGLGESHTERIEEMQEAESLASLYDQFYGELYQDAEADDARKEQGDWMSQKEMSCVTSQDANLDKREKTSAALPETEVSRPEEKTCGGLPISEFKRRFEEDVIIPEGFFMDKETLLRVVTGESSDVSEGEDRTLADEKRTTEIERKNVSDREISDLQEATSDLSNREGNNTNNNNTNINYTDFFLEETSGSEEKNKKTKKEMKKVRMGTFENVWLTEEELSQLQSAFPWDWKQRIEKISSYMVSTGKKYSNHYATLRFWALNESPGRSYNSYSNHAGYSSHGSYGGNAGYSSYGSHDSSSSYGSYGSYDSSSAYRNYDSYDSRESDRNVDEVDRSVSQDSNKNRIPTREEVLSWLL